jgi:hypothetical protein
MLFRVCRRTPLRLPLGCCEIWLPGVARARHGKPGRLTLAYAQLKLRGAAR